MLPFWQYWRIDSRGRLFAAPRIAKGDKQRMTHSAITPTGPALREPPTAPASGLSPPLAIAFRHRSRVRDEDGRQRTLALVTGDAVFVEHPDRRGDWYLDRLDVPDAETGERFALDGDERDAIKLALLETRRGEFDAAWAAHVAEHADAREAAQ